MAKANGTSRRTTPREANSTVDAIVAMRGSNQPDINTKAVDNLLNSYERTYNMLANVSAGERFATYKTPLDRGDHNDVLVVLEDRGDRVLAASIVYGMDLPLHPTTVVYKSDLVFHRTKNSATTFNSRR